jgi:hypothetical protein
MEKINKKFCGCIRKFETTMKYPKYRFSLNRLNGYNQPATKEPWNETTKRMSLFLIDLLISPLPFLPGMLLNDPDN